MVVFAVNIWALFVDPLARKIGLQMFPPDLRSAKDYADFKSLEIGSEITGKSVKYSEYGVYLDIGARDLVLLPKRKMKLERFAFHWQPWEIIPVGTEVNCLVYSIDTKKILVGVTTNEIHE